LPHWSKSRHESRDCELRDLDFLALITGLGLLVLLFRQIERWLHQHIFKVGWLLTNDFRITAVLYYIIFLPGILLHELTLWLAAGVLNVRAEGALQFPEEQDISALRLSVIRLAPDTDRFKLMLMALSPLASGLAALWAISAILFPTDASSTLALPSGVTELGAAISALTRTANFWLWLYVVFTIANRSFPTLPVQMSTRQKFLLLPVLLALCFGLWRVSDATNPAIALGIEGLLGGLTLIFAQITVLNLGCVLMLGAIEALIERMTSRSATFRDGRMITLDGAETVMSDASPARSRPRPAIGAAARPAASATSIYDLKLPIPGPPGREPVSRQAVAVVDLDRPAADSRPDHELSAATKSIRTLEALPDAKAESARETPPLMSEESGRDAGLAAAVRDPAAPFARPFAKRDAPGSAPDTRDDAGGLSKGEPFARPFVMSTRSDQPVSADDSYGLDTNPKEGATTDSEAGDTDMDLVGELPQRRTSRTRPAPKPSQRITSEPGRENPPGASELEYEDLDEYGAYDPDDGRYNDEL